MGVTNIGKIASRAYSTITKAAVFTETIPAPQCGRIRIIRLNRPAAHNAISLELLSGLTSEVEAIANETDREKGTRAVIIASNTNDHFCVGADLKERRSFTQSETESFLAALNHTYNTLAALPIPSISAIHGFALGGGLELALCTRFRIVASTSFLGLPETRLAIIPGAGGTVRLPALVGQTRAADLILTGRRVGAAEALGMGLCDRVVEVEAEAAETEGVKGRARELVGEAAVAMAREICRGGPVAVNQALRAVRTGQEREAYAAVLRTEDRLEALAAFAEKRKPQFKGQ